MQGGSEMNILYYFKEYQTNMHLWQRIHFIDELSYHGIKFDVFNPLSFKDLDEANEKLLLYCKKNAVDLFMTPHNEQDLYFETLKTIKKQGIPTLLICFDNLIVPYFHKKISFKFDLVWLTSKETQYLFDKTNTKSIFQSYAANPYFVKKRCRNSVDKLLFIGNPYGSRTNLINEMLLHDIKLDLYGKYDCGEEINKNQGISYSSCYEYMKLPIGRKLVFSKIKQKFVANNILNVENSNLNIYEPVSFDEMINLYDDYALALSSTTARNSGVLKNPVNVVNLRNFEIPMCRGVQFCRYTDEIASYFEEDMEAIYFKSDDEMIEKAKFYLKEEQRDKIEQIKCNARIRAGNDHTWFVRFSKIFELLGLEY